jgi:hypothetical protein
MLILKVMLIFAGIQFFQQPKDLIGSTTMKEYKTATKRAFPPAGVYLNSNL